MTYGYVVWWEKAELNIVQIQIEPYKVQLIGLNIHTTDSYDKHTPAAGIETLIFPLILQITRRRESIIYCTGKKKYGPPMAIRLLTRCCYVKGGLAVKQRNSLIDPIQNQFTIC